MVAASKPARLARISEVCLFSISALVCLSCTARNGNGNGVGVAEGTVAVPSVFPYDPFAISPDGTLVVHIPAAAPQPQSQFVNVLDVRDVKSGRQVALIAVPVQADANGFDFSDIQYCDRGRYVMALGRAVTDDNRGNTTSESPGDLIKVLDMQIYKLHATINLNAFEYPPPKEVLARQTGSYHGRSGGLAFASCAANAPIAAFFIDYGYGFGALKVFNLDTGVEVPGTEGFPLQSSAEGMAVSPLGSIIALRARDYHPKFQPGSYYDHVVTFVNLKTKRTAVTLKFASDDNAGPNVIAFAGESTVAVPFFERDPASQVGSLDRESVHFFDVASGAQIGTISDPANDFRFKGISVDGRTLLVYSGKSRMCYSCNHGFGQQVVTDARFDLWDRETGKPFAQSPSLKIIHHTCPWTSWFDSGTGWGACRTSDEIPVLALSQDGNSVVASWVSGGEPIMVYRLPTH